MALTMACSSAVAARPPACPATTGHGTSRFSCSSARLSLASRPRFSASCRASQESRKEQHEEQAEAQLPVASPSFVARSFVAAASALVLFAAPHQSPALALEYQTYYGTAASASSYGGYGGNTSKRATAEYVYDVPTGWKERAISKVEKGTNGTDSEFYNPQKRTEKTYLLYLAGFRRLPPKDNVLNNIALSDVDLQDLLASAESFNVSERREDGQLYYDFDVDSPVGHSLISVTAAKNKLYAHFVNAPSAAWEKDEEVLRKIHASFKTVGVDPLAPPGEF